MRDDGAPARDADRGLIVSLERRGVTGPALTALAELPSAAGELRAAAFGRLRSGVVPTWRDLAGAVGLREQEAAVLIEAMVVAGLVDVDGDFVVGAAGLSSTPTAHRLVLDGVDLHTWCALDVLGIPAALGADARARSACSWCGATSDVAFAAGAPVGATALRVWFPRLACSNVRAEFCPQANLFCNDAHLAAWRAAAGDPAGERLGLAEIVAFGHLAWGDLADAPPAETEDRTSP